MKTSQVLAATAVIAGLLSAAGSSAQTVPPVRGPQPGARLEVGVNGLVPTGNFHNVYDAGAGASVQADLPLASNKLYLTLGTGVNRIYARDNAERSSIATDLTIIPVKVGLQYFPVGRLYAQGEVGASFLIDQSAGRSANTASFTVAPQIGYLIPLGRVGNLDAGVRYEINSGTFANSPAGRFFGVKLAYSFNL